MVEPLLKVEDLNVEYVLRDYKVNAVRNVSFYMNKGECIALVGESGSGKSTVAMAVMRLLPPYAKISAKKITFDGKDILEADEELMTEIRGKEVTVIFQDPVSYLNSIISSEAHSSFLRISSAFSRAFILTLSSSLSAERMNICLARTCGGSFHLCLFLS